MSKGLAVEIGKVFVVIALLFGVAACGPSDQGDTANSIVHTYSVRGQVKTMPVPGDPSSSFMIHHEAIPGFVDMSGKTVGMKAMTMSFTPAKDLSLATLKPGDKIAFTLTVDWRKNRSEITQFTVLPEDTALDFGGKMSPMHMDK